MADLEVPDDGATWLNVLGVAPQVEEVSGDPSVMEARIPLPDAEELHLTWDVAHGSVRVRYRQADRTVVDLYRERATLLSIHKTDASTALVAEYRAGDCIGRIRMQTAPHILVTDEFLQA